MYTESRKATCLTGQLAFRRVIKNSGPGGRRFIGEVPHLADVPPLEATGYCPQGLGLWVQLIAVFKGRTFAGKFDGGRVNGRVLDLRSAFIRLRRRGLSLVVTIMFEH